MPNVDEGYVADSERKKARVEAASPAEVASPAEADPKAQGTGTLSSERVASKASVASQQDAPKHPAGVPAPEKNACRCNGRCGAKEHFGKHHRPCAPPPRFHGSLQGGW